MTSTNPDDSYDAVVLAGGKATRMDGADKCAQLLAGVALLDHVLAAVVGAEHVVVVGSPRQTARPVQWTRESPPGGGPVSGLAAGLAHVANDVAVVVAGDTPFAGTAIPRLVRALQKEQSDAALLVDETGKEQPLLAAYRTEALRTALETKSAGASMRSVVAELRWTPVAATGMEAFDCDTPADLAQARAVLEGR